MHFEAQIPRRIFITSLEDKSRRGGEELLVNTLLSELLPMHKRNFFILKFKIAEYCVILHSCYTTEHAPLSQVTAGPEVSNPFINTIAIILGPKVYCNSCKQQGDPANTFIPIHLTQ